MKLNSFKKKYKLSFSYGKIISNNFFFKKSDFFKINYSDNNLNYPRLGIYISKKCIKLSNKRNLLKRLIREYFRINKYKIYNLDYILKLKYNFNFNYNYNIDYFKKDINKIFNFFIKRNI
ncbi:ribonuclease P protein component [endosymbiont of Pachyrhynchus infernalis]|uniref:ribonuclease P protein component n=1 Tax=endosymbiont of Pachyrhynchus infernalis TaxID=1971488 RepID=UPI0038B54B19